MERLAQDPKSSNEQTIKLTAFGRLGREKDPQLQEKENSLWNAFDSRIQKHELRCLESFGARVAKPIRLITGAQIRARPAASQQVLRTGSSLCVDPLLRDRHDGVQDFPGRPVPARVDARDPVAIAPPRVCFALKQRTHHLHVKTSPQPLRPCIVESRAVTLVLGVSHRCG